MVIDERIIVKELSRLDRPALERHFLALDSEDRRLRFGLSIVDDSVRAYVARINFEHDAAFGIFDETLQLLAAAHLARDDNGNAELGVSVLSGHRGRGRGGALLARAHTHARNWGEHTLFMHCLRENKAMMHLARKQGMEIITEAGDADAHLKLPLADASSHFRAVFQQRVALFDQAFKTQLLNARRIADALGRAPIPGSASPAPEK